MESVGDGKQCIIVDDSIGDEAIGEEPPSVEECINEESNSDMIQWEDSDEVEIVMDSGNSILCS